MTNEDLADHLSTVVFDTIEKDKTLIKQNIAEAILKELMFRMKDEVVYSPLDEMIRRKTTPEPRKPIAPSLPCRFGGVTQVPVSGKQVLAELDKAAAERRARRELRRLWQSAQECGEESRRFYALG